jgi:hypothetical protein
MRPYEDQESNQMRLWLQSLATHDVHNSALLNHGQEPLPVRLLPMTDSLQAASSTPTSPFLDNRYHC